MSEKSLSALSCLRSFGSCLLLAASPLANSFTLSVHEDILRRALTGYMDETALSAVIGSYELGTGNLGSDLLQRDRTRHFDSAPDIATLCSLWRNGIDLAMNAGVEQALPSGEEKREARDRIGSLNAFGQVTHAIQDFYSHSNWVELYVRAGLSPPQAGLLGRTCELRAGVVPGELQTGYFGCPVSARPPKPFRYCHLQLSKDDPWFGHGREPIAAGSKVTYHHVARDLAIRATRDAWLAFLSRLVERVKREQRTADPQCVVTKLAWGGDRSCVNRWRIQASVQDRSAVQRRSLAGLDFTLTWTFRALEQGPKGSDAIETTTTRCHWEDANRAPGATVVVDAGVRDTELPLPVLLGFITEGTRNCAGATDFASLPCTSASKTFRLYRGTQIVECSRGGADPITRRIQLDIAPADD